MIRAFRYRLHPNASQERALDEWRRQCCTLYNAALEQRILGWQKIKREVPRDKTDDEVIAFKRQLTRYGQQVQLTELRESDEAWAKVPAVVQRSALRRIELAYEAFFRRLRKSKKADKGRGCDRPGFPRFRSIRRYDSFSIGLATVRGDRLFVPKLGHVKISLYRPIGGEIKNVTIMRDSTGKWWAGFQCDVGDAPQKPTVVHGMVGMDLGLTTLATLSNGDHVGNPRFSRRSADLLARRQLKLARKKNGSNNRERERVIVAKTYKHIANQRLSHARLTAKQLFDRFDAIAYEGLGVAALSRGMFSKSFADASWGILLRCLASKAEDAGKHWVPVDHRETSQLCCACGRRVEKTLKDRVHRCVCGLTIDRDLNAAINVLTRGLRVLELINVSVEGETPTRSRVADFASV